MTHRIAENCLKALHAAGADKAQVCVTETERQGFSVENRRIFLSRDSVDRSAELTAIAGGYAALTVNGFSGKDAGEAARAAVDRARAAPQDLCRDISPAQPSEDFDNGVRPPDMSLLFDRLEEFLAGCAQFPSLNIRRMSRLEFLTEKKTFLNSNGAAFISRTGYFELYLIFSSGDGKRSSLGYLAQLRARDLGRPLLEWGSLENLIKQSAVSIGARSVPGGFTGDIIVAPECLGTFIDFAVDGGLRDGALIPGTSVYRGKIGARIASPGFSVSSRPASTEIASGYFITPDGYKAADLAIIEDGYLRSFILSQYGARKTGLQRVSNAGGCYDVAPGIRGREDLIAATKKGLLLSRLSCDQPAQNGDFSGVVKNSYYIEDGKIKFPVSETMISGNIYSMLQNVNGISRERVNLGSSVYPWVSFGGLTIKGK